MSDSGGIEVRSCSRSYWEEVGTKVNKAIVFLDDSSAECLHWHGGALHLFNAGAVDVKPFSSFESGMQDQAKAVFIIGEPLTKQSTHTQTLKHIVEASKFQYVIVVSTLSPAMHTIIDYGAGEEEMKGFYALEERLLEWMGNMNYTAEVIYLPLVVAPITDQLFTLPEHADVFPLLQCELDTILQQAQKEKPGMQISDLEFHHTGRELQLQLKLLTCSINSMLETLRVSDDVYAIGHTSRIVASELASLSWAKGRRKSSQRKASILLVDRSLDLANVVSHQMETLADKLLTALPIMEGHTLDVCVDMTPLCSVKSNPNFTVIAPGSLAHTSDTVASPLWNTFSTGKHKESLMELNRQLVEAATRENLPVRLSGRPGRVTVEQLETHINLFKQKMKPIKNNSGLLQLALATVQALNSTELSKIDSLLAAEKGLLPSLGDDDTNSALLQIVHKLQQDLNPNTVDKKLVLENVMMLIIYLYSLSEWNINSHKEYGLQTTLEKALLTTDFDELPEYLQQLVGEDKTQEAVSLAVEELFKRLNAIYQARDDLKNFRSVIDSDTMSTKCLMKQLVEKILDPGKPELPDVIYKSTGFRDLLKSGFGLFMNVSKPRPSDHPLLIVFIIGGTTTSELRQIREVVTASKSNIQVLLGSTTLLRPSDLLERVAVQDHLQPETCLYL